MNSQGVKHSEFTGYPHLVAGTSNNGGEHSPGGVVSGEAGLAHAGAIVNDQSGDLIVTHDGVVCVRVVGGEQRLRGLASTSPPNLYIGRHGP